MALVKKFIAPALPLPSDVYDRRTADELVRALRLYFNLMDRYFVDTILDAFNGGLGGNTITLPHIAASDSTDQHTTDDTATAVNFNTLDSGFGWTLNSPGSATADVAGVYTIRYSIQFANTDNAQHTATAWLQKNGADVANSATTFSVPARKSASIPGFICAYSEATFTIAVGDEIELYWATDQADVVSPAADGILLFHDAAQASPFPRPAIPSVIGSIVWVSALP
jgi:plastocyanin